MSHKHLMGLHRTCPFCHSRLYDPDATMGHFLSKHEFRFEKANGLAKWMWDGDTEWDEDALLERSGITPPWKEEPA